MSGERKRGQSATAPFFDSTLALAAQTTLAGDSHILNIIIGDPLRKRAGLYKDVITIQIVPN